jgi:hypothetical protein
MKKVGIILVLAVVLLTVYTLALAQYATVNADSFPTASTYDGGL